MGQSPLLLFAQGQAKADNNGPYALVSVRNSTDSAVTYFYWWGDAKWNEGGSNAAREITLQPGERYLHAREFSANRENAPPRLNIAFAAFTRGKNVPNSFQKEYPLARGQGPAREFRYARAYFFDWDRDGRLDLYEGRGR